MKIESFRFIQFQNDQEMNEVIVLCKHSFTLIMNASQLGIHGKKNQDQPFGNVGVHETKRSINID